MERAKEIIETLAEQDGVNLAMIVSRDGFILELGAEREAPQEPETVGAAVSTYWSTVDAMGGELAAEVGLNSIVEFRGALLATSLLVQEDLILTVVADPQMNPATIRYLTCKFSELLETLL